MVMFAVQQTFGHLTAIVGLTSERLECERSMTVGATEEVEQS